MYTRFEGSYQVIWRNRVPVAGNPLKVGARVRLKRRRSPTYGVIMECLTQVRSLGSMQFRNPYCMVAHEADLGHVTKEQTQQLEFAPKARARRR